MDTSVGSVGGRSAAASNASQLTGQESIFLESGASAFAPSAPAFERGHSLAVEELGLRHLKTLAEIEEILYLREAIDLSVHSRAHSDFVALEKKETSAVSSVLSSCAGKS